MFQNNAFWENIFTQSVLYQYLTNMGPQSGQATSYCKPQELQITP